MELRVYAVTDVCLYGTAAFGLCVRFNYVAVVAEQSAWFGERDGVVETLAGGFDHADGVRICGCGTDVVGLIDVAVEAAVVEGDVQIYNVAVFEHTLVRDAVADDFVDGRADRLGKVVVVEW